ncbi:MAG: radical SAM family heme chaperone HemW [Ruminococcaceae bacterium]|nr:radical SAM family heme chaperone HemW [Oscillospiraceae bacterium]
MIYIHIPFCVRKCLYCDFYSITDKGKSAPYIKALKDEIASFKGMHTSTVYIGGGTPTALGEGLVEVIDAVNESFVFDGDVEFTVEANPGTVNEELLKKLRGKGVNRISLGAQSFNDNELAALGRIHTASDIFHSCDAIKSAGFENFSIDLMLATPYQSMESLSYSLDCVEKISPPHVSAYSLIVEEGTPFYDMQLNLPDEDTERQMYYYTTQRLHKNGLYRYEISNFAKKGYESRHNCGYWKDCEYIGIGAGAHSYFGGARFCNAPDIERYILGEGRKEDYTQISERERKLELFMLGLRMTEGVLYNGEFKDKVNPLIEKGLLKLQGGRLMLTDRGTDCANLVFMEFLDD